MKREKHLSWEEIVKVFEGERLEEAREKHFFRCSHCQKKVELLMMLDESEINFCQDVSAIVFIDQNFDCFVLKGEYVHGYVTRGPERFSKKMMKEYSHSIDSDRYFVDIQKMENGILIKDLYGKNFRYTVLSPVRGEVIAEGMCAGECMIDGIKDGIFIVIKDEPE